MTFVNVHTVVVGAQFETRVTMAFVLSNHINTTTCKIFVSYRQQLCFLVISNNESKAIFTIVTDVRMPLTFIDVNAVVSGGCQKVTNVTDTLEASLEVFAVTVQTDIWFFYAFVYVNAVHKRSTLNTKRKQKTLVISMDCCHCKSKTFLII